MTKISITEVNENSPRKQFAKDFNIAFAKGEMSYVLGCFSEDVEWSVVNHETVHGKQSVSEMLSEMDEVADELVIEHILEDGNKCMVNGTLTYAGSAVTFCDIYVFDNQADDMKIKTLIGYPIELKNK